MTAKGVSVCVWIILFWLQFVTAIIEVHRHHYHYHDFSGFQPLSLNPPAHVENDHPVLETTEKNEPSTTTTENATTQKAAILKDVINDYLVSEEPEEAITTDNKKSVVTTATTSSTPVTTTTTTITTTAKNVPENTYKTTRMKSTKFQHQKKVNSNSGHNVKHGIQQVHFKIHIENDKKSKQYTNTNSKSANRYKNVKKTSGNQQKVNVVHYNIKNKQPKETSYSDSYIKLWS